MLAIPVANWLKGITEEVPWFPTTFACTIIALLILVGILILWRGAKGDDISILWFIKITPNAALKKAKEEFDDINKDSAQKTMIIKLLNQMSLEIPLLTQRIEPETFFSYRDSIYDYILPGILSIITKNKDDGHRIAVFIEENNELRIHEGIGFSPAGRENLRLPIPNSAAGRVYHTGEQYYCQDLENDNSNVFKKNHQSSKRYRSLVCVPIKYGNMIIGVLSMDGENPSSFNKDDIHYINCFAASVAPLLYMDLDLMGKFDVERSDEHGDSSKERVS